MHVYIYDPRSLTLIYVCMILDLDSDAFMYVSFLTVMFVCMCDAQILDPDTCIVTMMHIPIMHLYMILIHDAFINVP